MTEPPTRYVTLGDFVRMAAAASISDERELLRVCRLDLADAALNRPAAFHRDRELYRGRLAKAAALGVALARSRALLPNSVNIQVAFMCLWRFVLINDIPVRIHRDDHVLALWLLEQIQTGAAAERDLAVWLAANLDTDR